MTYGTSQSLGGDQATVRDGAGVPREQSRIGDSEDDMGGHNPTDEGPDLSPDAPATGLEGVTLPEVEASNHADSEEKPERCYPQGLHKHPNT